MRMKLGAKPIRWVTGLCLVLIASQAVGADSLEEAFNSLDKNSKSLLTNAGLDYYEAKASLDQKLASALKAKAIEAQKAGDLKRLLALREDIEAFESSKASSALKSEETAPLGKIHAAELRKLDLRRSREIHRIKKAQAKAVDGFVKKFTQAGEADNAGKATAELKKIQAEIANLEKNFGAPGNGTGRSHAAIAKGNPRVFKASSGPNPFDQKMWTADFVIGPGRIDAKGQRTEVKKSEKSAPRPNVEIKPGTMIENGILFANDGNFTGKDSYFREMTFPVDLHAILVFSDSAFESCEFKKGGVWSTKKWSGKWQFDNCAFGNSFFSQWNTKKVSVKATRCTFYGVTFPTFSYREDAAVEVKSGNLYLKNCKFVDCEIPVSVLLFCQDCMFEKCRILPAKEDYPISSPITRTLYAPDQKDPVSGGSSMFSIEVSDMPVEAGATIPHSYSSRKLVMLE